jgi:hypothetical protein
LFILKKMLLLFFCFKIPESNDAEKSKKRVILTEYKFTQVIIEKLDFKHSINPLTGDNEHLISTVEILNSILLNILDDKRLFHKRCIILCK